MKNILGKLSALLLLLSFAFILISCNNIEQTDIVTTLYPQYDIAKQIAGDKLEVSLMTPFGSEVHGYEPTAKDIIRVNNSKLFIYTSDQMERWAKNIIETDTNFINLSELYTLVPYHNPDAIVDSLHYWTDPMIIMELIDIIKNEIIKIDPANIDYYEQNALAYLNEINIVHEELITFFSDKAGSTIYFYGHNAMSSFGNRYNFNIVSLSSNYQPDAELSPGQILNLKNKIKEANAKFLFVEELIDLKAPNSLKDELHREGYFISILELHGFHNISSKQNEKGVSYVDLLKQNLENLKTALN
jgi:zinc transport system substrate-binding protein